MSNYGAKAATYRSPILKGNCSNKENVIKKTTQLFSSKAFLGQLLGFKYPEVSLEEQSEATADKGAQEGCLIQAGSLQQGEVPVLWDVGQGSCGHRRDGEAPAQLWLAWGFVEKNSFEQNTEKTPKGCRPVLVR